MPVPLLKFAFSPCPNDTFMFHALVHGIVDTVGYEIQTELLDIEKLNSLCRSGLPDVCKISVINYPDVVEDYEMLTSGAALGRNCGPLIISKQNFSADELQDKKIAIPGFHTTANFLLNIFFPQIQNKTEVIFSEIEGRVLSGEFDAGLIIHESRFTYSEKGLMKIADLGELWELETAMPLPLGCVVARRSLGESLIGKLNHWMHQSVSHALAHSADSRTYVQAHAQEMDTEVIQKHIDLYVNEFSVDLGVVGLKAMAKFMERANQQEFLEEFYRNKSK